jgi:anti-sigma regulatory factor (Ser/Thr protein kinase)
LPEKERIPVPILTAPRSTTQKGEYKLPLLPATEARPVWLAPVALSAASPRAYVRPRTLGDSERRLKFRGLPQAVGAARRALREWEEHFEPNLFYDLSLCVSELVTNRVQRAEPGCAEEIELIVRRSEELVRAEVRESPTDALVIESPITASSDWGMFIVDRIADRWGADRSGGTVVWCEIDLAGNGRSRHASMKAA